ncbi:MAG TPA: serine hydrolase, partial [Candidatus Paceibacterota bacterium]|nr:serine hydrolase [Candidatus Paceibacterota bacterium]
NTDVVCGPDDVIRKGDYEKTRLAVQQYIDKQKQKGTVADVAVYFRDLIHGPLFGINELEDYAPASLLKLPLAMAYGGLDDTYPGLFGKKIGYLAASSTLTTQNFPPAVTAERGKFYTIQELMYDMLVYSDNASYTILADYYQNHIPNGVQLLYQAYQDLGILAPQETLDQNISVHSYAGIFRNLYNGSYLDAKTSEELLSWLAKSTFTEGLVAGVPDGVKVAHKFGEFTFPNNTHQLHDCGIVYYPDNPYLLCVMTKGTDWSALEETIATISKTVYTEVDARRL